MRHIFQLIKTAVRSGDFKTIAQMAVADKRLDVGIQHSHTIHNHPVVVKAGSLRSTGGVGPHAVGTFDHVMRNTDDGNLHILRVGRIEVERHAVHQLQSAGIELSRNCKVKDVPRRRAHLFGRSPKDRPWRAEQQDLIQMFS